MANIKEDAEALRRGLLAGFANVEDAVAWADAVIVREAAPHPAVIEVALAGRRPVSEVVSLLREVPGEADPVRFHRLLLGHMLRALDADPSRGEDIARFLYFLSRDGELPEAEFGGEPEILDYTFELAQEQVRGTYETAVAELREYLARHAVPGAR